MNMEGDNTISDEYAVNDFLEEVVKQAKYANLGCSVSGDGHHDAFAGPVHNPRSLANHQQHPGATSPMGGLPTARKQVALTASTPGTPPDTPLGSNACSLPASPAFAAVPASNLASPVMQPASLDCKNTSSLLNDDMNWLTQSLRYSGVSLPEPLDLRQSEMDAWFKRDYTDIPMMPQHAQNSPRGANTLAAMVSANHPSGDEISVHQQHVHPHQQPQQQAEDQNQHRHHHPQNTVGAVNHHHHQTRDILEDDDLVHLSVRDLNKKLHGFPRDEVVRLKLKRRTLKNRGYAQNCRTKRLKKTHEMEDKIRMLQEENARLRPLVEENARLRPLVEENARLRQEINRLRQERDDRDLHKHDWLLLGGNGTTQITGVGGNGAGANNRPCFQGSLSSVSSGSGSNPSSPEDLL